MTDEFDLAKISTPPAPKSLPPPPAAAVVTITMDTEIGARAYDYERDEYCGRSQTVADAIVNQAASRLVREVQNEVVKMAIARVDEQIVAQVRDLVAEVLAEPFRATSTYGGAGKSTTIREQIAERVAQELTPSRNSYSSNQPVIAEVLKREVQQALTQELSGAVKAARDKVVGAVRDQAAELIGQAVKAGLR